MKKEALKIIQMLESSCEYDHEIMAANMIRRLVEELDKQERFNKENPVKEVFNSEPVACIVDEELYFADEIDWEELKGTPLYTSPQTKPLSDEEIYSLMVKCIDSPDDGHEFRYKDFARAIEAKVRGKE
jgi:hypothetical protein